MLDTISRVETPEGIELRLHAAGAMPRAAAWLLDFFIRLAAVTAGALLLGFLGDTGQGIYLLFLFAVYWMYPVLFEVLRGGQTIGKQVIGIKVIHQNGTPVTWVASLVRNLLRTVDMLPFCYGIGLVASLLDRQGRRLGDAVAGTLVVHVVDEALTAPAPPAPVVLPDCVLTPDEKGAIVAFAERAAQLTNERQAELAELLLALSRARGAPGVQRLLGMANGFLGRH